MNNAFRSLISPALCLLLAVLCFSLPASAETPLDIHRSVSLNIQLIDGETPISGTDFLLYKVTDAVEPDDTAITAVFEPFKKGENPVLPESLNSAPAGGWAALADQLANLVTVNNIRETCQLTTGSDGRATKTDLTPGLYFVTATPTILIDQMYTVNPFLLFLPGQDTDGEWDYDVDLIPKFDKVQTYIEDTPEITTTLEGIAPELAPDFYYTMEPYKGEPGWETFPMPSGTAGSTEKVTIKAEGDASFGTIHFDTTGKFVYLVKEINTGIEGYTYDTREYYLIYEVTSKDGQMGFTRKLCTTDYNPVTVLHFVNKYAEPQKTPTPAEVKLPQTGLLWWPVPLLFLLGFLLVCWGKALNRRCPE